MATIKVAVDAREAKVGAQEVVRATDSMDKGARKAAKGSDQLKGKMDALGPASNKLKTAFAGLAASIGAAFALNQARQVIGGYEQTMANLRGVTEATTEEMVRFNDASIELGSKSTFNPDEVANGLLNIAKAGYNAGQAIGAIPAAMDLAVGGEVSLNAATEAIAKTLAQFGLGVNDAERAANSLVIAANATQASVESMGEGMKYAGPLAHKLQMSLEETAAALGVLSNAGIEGSMAGTNVRGMMASLLNPSAKAKKVFADLFGSVEEGLRLMDVKSKDIGLVDALKSLADAGVEADQLGRIFGQRNVVAAGALGDMADEVEKVTDQITKNKHAAADLAKIMGNTLNGSLKNLSSTVSTVWIKMGESGLGGAMKYAVDFTIDVIRSLAGITAKSRSGSASIEKVANAVRALAAASAAFIALQLGAGLVSVATGALKAGGAMAKLTALIAANPIGILALAIGAAVYAWLEFKDEVISVGDEFTTFGDIVRATWDFVTEGTVSAWNALIEVLVKAWDWLKESFWGVIKWVGDAWGDLMESLGVDWTGVWDTIMNVLKVVANAIIGTFVAIGNIVKALINRIVDVSKAFASFDFSSPFESFTRIGKALVDPRKMFGELKDGIFDAYAEDYVGQMVGAIGDAYESSEGAIKKVGGVAGLILVASRDEILRRAVKKTKTARAESDRLKKMKEEAEKAGKATEELNRKTVDLEAGLDGVGEAAAEAAKDLIALQTELADEIATMERIIELRDLSTAALERQLALDDFRKRAVNAEIKDVDGLVNVYGELLDKMELINNQRSERERMAETLADLRKEVELIGLVNAERDKELAIYDVLKGVKSLDAQETAALVDEYARLFTQLQEAERIKEVSDSIADSFGNAFESIRQGATSLVDVMKNLFFDIERILIDSIVTKPLAASISSGLQDVFGGLGFGGILNAHGNAYSMGQQVTRYSRGGVTSGPEYFPLNGGKTGLRGEAGQEGILPLRRLSNGDLGVQSDGSGGGGSTIVNMNVYAKDADSFRKSQRQIVSDLRRATGERKR